MSATGLTLSLGLRPDADGPGGEGFAPATRTRDTPAPALAGRTLRGAPFDLAGLRGHAVLVNVWASWCDPCRRELPLLADAARRWSGRGLRLVGLDVRDDPAQARDLLRAVERQTGPVPMTVVADPAGTTAVGWGVRGVPETFLVDPRGRVRVWAQGAVTAGWLERWVPPLLAP